MTIRSLLRLFTAAIAITSIGVGPLEAAHERGNGSDAADLFAGSAWFTAEGRTVNACIERASDFGADAKAAKKAIVDAVALWEKYYNSKQISQTWKPSFAYSVRDACKGDEDLTFYFGVTNEDVEREKQRYVDPIGFATRAEYDPAIGWSKGFVWIAEPKAAAFTGAFNRRHDPFNPPNSDQIFPDWNRPNVLLGILVHELGHIFGVPHVPGTIMREDISTLLSKAHANPAYEHYLTSIDHQVILVTYDYTGRELPGIFGDRNSNYDWDKKLFFKLFQRMPVGDVTARLVSKNIRRPGGWDYGLFIYDLVVTDSLGALNVPVVLNGGSLVATQMSQVFYAARYTDAATAEQNGIPYIQYADSSSSIAFGVIKGSNGQKHSVVMSINMSSTVVDSRAVEVYLVEQGRRQRVFGMLLPGETAP